MTEVPPWCEFFDGEKYEEFCDEVDEAAAAFGADGQDLSSGSIVLAAGDRNENPSFPLDHLARACHARPREEWADLCFAQVDGWSVAAAQARWLVGASFDQVRERLGVHLDDGRRHWQGTERDDPREPCRLPLADGLWAGLWVADVPGAHEDEPELDVQVHNAAARAWGVEADELVRIALGNVRRNGPPAWTEVQAGPVTLLEGWGSDAASWALLLDEVLPERTGSVLVGVPGRSQLILCLDGGEHAEQVMRERVRHVHAATDVLKRISDRVYRHREGGVFEVV
ncbi:hypothetical protein [Actinomadura hibisca]|uniref:hypothetical protein n=1 Tax=Actinomadura hibisca TaxID=68565 RepID=UPI0008328AEB|nr:hypothetical protein [Actinomadura hibisca]